MKMIDTGKGRITLLTLLAVWSISLVVDLPGLAISPVLSELDTIFPHATHLEIQLLSTLPNFCIIPFILLSGKLSTSRSGTALINTGMLIFLAGGVACFFARSMTALIVTSCVIGVGCGLVIPLAAGVIADLFSGVDRVRQMGIKSGIANFTLVFATLVVGWMGTGDWHLPFLVYLVPVIPLALSPFLSKGYLRRTAGPSVMTTVKPSAGKADGTPAPATPDTAPDPSTPLGRARSSRKASVAAVWGIMAFYLTVTVCTLTVSYYLPFLMQDYGMPDSETSVVTSVFFLFVTAAGFLLPQSVKLLRNRTAPVCVALMAGGVVLIAAFHSFWVYLVAVMAAGAGYGLLQPIFYTKASLLSPTSAEATKTISYIMTANYLGTALTPLVFSGLGDLFHAGSHVFAFWTGGAVLAVTLVLALLKRKSFVFFISLREA